MPLIDDVSNRARALQPGLEVSMFAVPRQAGRSVLRIGARGGATPLRLHLYVDGELVESWTSAPPSVTFELRGLAPGRHAVTVRAIDAAGRWGGSSIVVP